MKSKNKKVSKTKKKSPKKVASKTESVSTSVAKGDDGTIQITYTIPYKDIELARKVALAEVAKESEIPGFRKGKAPLDKVAERMDSNTLVEKTLQKILPNIFLESVKNEKINPATYPKFEVVKAIENEPWEVRAVTCELPNIDLTDYKKRFVGAAKTQTIWTPDQGSKNDVENKEVTNEEKEQQAIKIVLETIKVNIPKVLIDEEVNAKLSSLLERIEKLGLTLESYLASTNKTAEALRKDYELQAVNTISLELILNEIARKESLEPDKKKVDEFILATQKQAESDQGNYDPERQKIMIENSLRKRAALDYIVSLL